ncbi:MAG: YegS/Rv2252/BmrU family lipid kinase [Actinomycetes bacterium]|jgi:diacylglycerol kinase (ATP)
MSWFVVVNPQAGRRPVPPQAVTEALRFHGVEHHLEVPASADETRAMVRAAANDGYTRVAAVGGDGTLSLVADELAPFGTEVTLAMLPAGTGCDLLRTFGLPQDVAGAAKHLTTDDTYLVDMVLLEGQWGKRHCINVSQAGVGAAALESALKLSRRLGPARYPLAFAGRLPGFPYANVKVTTERRTYEAEGALAVIAANAQFFAGGWNVAPKATLVDGVADMQVYVLRKRQAPPLVPKIIRGTHLNDPAVRRFRAAEFTIEADPVWPFEADGDLLGNTPVRGRVLPAAMRLKI